MLLYVKLLGISMARSQNRHGFLDGNRGQFRVGWDVGNLVFYDS